MTVDVKGFERYSRQMMLPQIGEAGQRRLARSSALIVGVGGLGSPVALYLAAAGVGRIGLVDADVVSVSNLQRQILYAESEVGLPKVEMAARRLAALNSDVEIETYACRLDESNAESIISHYDVVVDGCDNLRTRYLVDDVCGRLNKPYVFGAIGAMSGQVSVFHYGDNPRSYRELFVPDEACDGECEPMGVVGTTPAVIGSFEANEAIKILAGYGEVLTGRLLQVELDSLQISIISF